MNQKDKELLVIVLSAMLPYGVICDCLHDYHTKVSAVDAEDLTVYYPYCDEWESIEYCKPYLRPMSSMTKDEFKEWLEYSKADYDCEFKPEPTFSLEGCHLSIDWLNANHFDYRGLIPKGLAIEVTKENNPYENQNKTP